MTHTPAPTVPDPPPSAYWMRTVSFAGLNRLLWAVGQAPNGLRARDINALVLQHGLTLTPRRFLPKPTTLYHYRNTLLRLSAIVRDGLYLRANVANPHVDALLRQQMPRNDDQSLSDAAKDHFAALVLSNIQCRNLFFDVFMPSDAPCESVADFRERGCPVSWMRHPSTATTTAIVFRNRTTQQTIRHLDPTGVPAVLYGLRYWARDELVLVDEYPDRPGYGTIMFPVFQRTSQNTAGDPVLHAVQFVLSLRTRSASAEWTLLSVSDLLLQYCQTYRQSRDVLFDAITWLHREWPRHTSLIPTSRGLATLTAVSPGQEDLLLRRYYKPQRGPYISHLRLHRDVTARAMTA